MLTSLDSESRVLSVLVGGVLVYDGINGGIVRRPDNSCVVFGSHEALVQLHGVADLALGPRVSGSMVSIEV
jgi:hypothetical protein